MKMKITDLMDLYEDRHSPPSPAAEQERQAANDRPWNESSAEVTVLQQRKHAFGWKEILSLAAALALVVLGGFGLKQLLNRGPAQLPQGQPGTTESTRPAETNDVIWWGWYPLDCAEQEAFSSFLSVFARQNIRQVPEDLSTDGALIRLAFAWRRNNEPESLTVREGLPGLEIPHEGLTPEQVNETLKQLLGRSVAVPENGTEFDYSNQIGLPAGSTLFRSGWFWDEPTEPEPLRFALATYTLPDRSELLFTVYEWNTTDAASADPDTTFSLSTAQAEELADAGKLLRLQTGTAKLQQTERGWRLLSYQTEPAAEQHNVQASDLSEINWQLTYLAEQGIEKLDTDLDEEYELAQFVHIYLKRHSDPGSGQLSYQSDETGSYETVGLGWGNLILDSMFGKTLSPVEGTDYTVLRGDNSAQHESFHDGFFWWPAADGDTSTRFARCNWARQENGQVETSFIVYEADPAYLEQQRSQDITLEPGVDLEDWIWNQLIRMDDAELQAHIAAGEIIPIQTGTAKLQKPEQQGWRILSYTTEPFSSSTAPNPPEESSSVDPTRLNALLTVFAEQGITDSELDLAGEYELARFAHIYTKLHEPKAIRYQNAGGDRWETLTLEQINETLTRLLDKKLSPADGSDYTAQRGENYAQHESYHDGCFWWPAADGDLHLDFAIYDDHNYNLVGHGTEEVPFILLEAISEAWPDWESASLSELTTEDMIPLIEAGKLEMLSMGTATIRWDGTQPVMQSFQVKYANHAVYVLDSLLCARQTDPDGLRSVREIQLMRDNSFCYWERMQDSDYRYWCKGSWRMMRNGMRLDYTETDLFWSDTQATAQYAVYEIGYDNTGFHMTLVEGAGLGRDQIGWNVLYNSAPDVEEYDSNEDLPSADPQAEAAVRALFEDSNGWYCRALTSEYDDPLQVDLGRLFYNGIPGEEDPLSDEEWDNFEEELGGLTNRNTQPDRIPVSAINEVLSQVFGTDLESCVNAPGYAGMRFGMGQGYWYVPKSGCYYHFLSEPKQSNPIVIERVYQTENGLVCVAYHFPDAPASQKFVELRLQDDAYRILANLDAREFASIGNQ